MTVTQEEFEHELPLRPGDGHRISLTFRSIVPGFEDALGVAAEDPCVAMQPEGPPPPAQAHSIVGSDGWR